MSHPQYIVDESFRRQSEHLREAADLHRSLQAQRDCRDAQDQATGTIEAVGLASIFTAIKRAMGNLVDHDRPEAPEPL